MRRNANIIFFKQIGDVCINGRIPRMKKHEFLESLLATAVWSCEIDEIQRNIDCEQDTGKSNNYSA